MPGKMAPTPEPKYSTTDSSRLFSDTNDLATLVFGLFASVTAVITLALAVLQFRRSKRQRKEEDTDHPGPKSVITFHPY